MSLWLVESKDLFNKGLLDDPIDLLIWTYFLLTFPMFLYMLMFLCFLVFCSIYYKTPESSEIKERSGRKDCIKYRGFFPRVEILWKCKVFATIRANQPFPQNFQTRKLGDILVFYAVKLIILYILIFKCCRTLLSRCGKCWI